MQPKSNLKYNNLSIQNNNNSISFNNLSNSISFRNNNKNFRNNNESNLKIKSYEINIKPSNNVKNSNTLNKNLFINNMKSKNNNFNDDDEIIKLIILNSKDKNIKKKIEILKENNFDFHNLLNFEDDDDEDEKNYENKIIKTLPENKNKLKNNNLLHSYNKKNNFLLTSKNFNKTQTKLSDKNSKLKLDTFEYFDKINGKKHFNYNSKKKINIKKEKSKKNENNNNTIIKKFMSKKISEFRLNSKKIKDKEKKDNIEKYKNLYKLEKYINLLNNKNKHGNYFIGKINNSNRLNISENINNYYLKNY